MRKIILVIIATFGLITSWGQSNRFELSGDIQGYKDSTWIYLSDLSKKTRFLRPTDDKKFPFRLQDNKDSTLAVNGKFRFEGILMNQNFLRSIQKMKNNL